MVRTGALAPALLLVVLGAAPAVAADADATGAPPSPRIEARSADFLIVGAVQGEHMTIHVSRIADNAPVTDARLEVVLRGTAHATTAQIDGSYRLTTADLAIPGTAAVQFDVTEGARHETASGTLEIGAAAQESARGSSRQIGWWVLNILVCFGFLWLWNRRRKPESGD